MKLLTVSANPHVRDRATTQSIMLDVIIALVPALVASILLFGVDALLVVLVCVAVAVLAEYIWEKAVKRPVTISDLSAVVTGVLLAYCLPSTIPLWQAALGSIFAIIVVKQFFGGIGCNFANPAATARIMLFLAFSSEMAAFTYDGVSTATPLALMGQSAEAASSATGEAVQQLPGLLDMFLGRHGGCLGEVCALALLIGGIYLIARRVISWHIPVVYLVTVAVFSLLVGRDPLYDLLSGGLMLGAFFMATDYSTSPMTVLGKVIYAVIVGLLTMTIRVWGSYPEGVSFAILLGNILTPHIDRLTRHKPLGVAKKGGAKA